jgi:hypothetical protein
MILMSVARERSVLGQISSTWQERSVLVAGSTQTCKKGSCLYLDVCLRFNANDHLDNSFLAHITRQRRSLTTISMKKASNSALFVGLRDEKMPEIGGRPAANAKMLYKYMSNIANVFYSLKGLQYRLKNNKKEVHSSLNSGIHFKPTNQRDPLVIRFSDVISEYPSVRFAFPRKCFPRKRSGISLMSLCRKTSHIDSRCERRALSSCS